MKFVNESKRSIDLKQVLLLILLCGFTLPAHVLAQPVRLATAPQAPLAEPVKVRTTDIVNAINGPGTWRDFTITGKNPAIGLLNKLVDERGIRSVRTPASLYLEELEDGTAEVRNLFVTSKRIGQERHGELVLHFGRKGALIGARMAAPLHSAQVILDRKLYASEQAQVEVRKWMESFREAVQSRNIQQLRTMIAPHALLVNGARSRFSQPRNRNRPRFRYFKLSRPAYLQRLADPNGQKPKLNIRYDSLQVYRHPNFARVYAVVLKQQWQSPAYTDTGYLTLTVDLRSKPLIRSRVWQEYAPETGGLQPDIETARPEAYCRTGNAAFHREPGPFPKAALPETGTPRKHFLARPRNWIIFSAATALTTGYLILQHNGGEPLPNPPGRPAIQ